MKNLIRKISLIMCVIMLTFAVSACGKSDNDSKKNEQQQLETQLASLEGSGIALNLTAEDNKLIYNFTIEDADLSAALAADPSTLESSLQSQASTFESVASSLKAAVEVENPVVVVRYLDNTGAEIVAQEFAG